MRMDLIAQKMNLYKSLELIQLKWNGTPCNKLPKATPNTNAGTKPPANNPQSQTERQVGLSILHDIQNPMDVRITLPRLILMQCKKNLRKILHIHWAMLQILHHLQLINQTWLPSQWGAIVLIIMRRSTSFFYLLQVKVRSRPYQIHQLQRSQSIIQ